MDDFDKINPEPDLQNLLMHNTGQLLGDVMLNTLLESLAEGVVIINERGRIVLINKRFAQLTGYGKQEVIGQSLSIFLPEGMDRKHEQDISDYFAKPRIRPLGADLNLIAKRKDNSVFPVEISLSHLKTGTEDLGIAFITDISARKKAEEELLTRNQELDAYARNVAHDLNTPLASLINFSDLLLDSDFEISDEERKHYLEIIAEDSRKMSSIIKELLIFATIKKEDIRLSTVHMKEPIENVISRLRFQIEQKSVQLKIDKNICDCSGYGPWIEEVWFNYISNAIRYGGTPPLIEIGSEVQNSDFIKYFVKDNGSGVSPEFKAIAFQTNNSQKDKLSHGYGIGLSIVKSIVEKLGGYVDVESPDGKGSVFSFYLKRVSV
jgi:PAS domain S-box-containing protein